MDPVFDIYNENLYYFELLFCFEELNVSSNVYRGEQRLKQRLVIFLAL